MRTLFICGSIENGRDGVGDYTCRLAAEVSRQGHKVTIAALSDRYITDKFIGVQVSDGIDIRVLRIPVSFKDQMRFKLLKEWIYEFEPDWLSLQFVPYGFHKNGLSVGLGHKLKNLYSKGRWHIMFHELWVGVEVDSNWKRKLLSRAQRFLVNSMIRYINPAVIHTQLPEYKLQLEKLNRKVNKLPLFSNISVVKTAKNNVEKSVFRIAFFSQAEYTEPIRVFLTNIAEQVLANGMEIEVLLISGEKKHMRTVAENIEKIDQLTNKVRCTGFLKNEELSKTIQSCNMGITPVPRHGLGKSGSVAAFITHGIPVAAPNVHFRFSESEIGFFTDTLCSSIILNPNLDEIENAAKAAVLAKGEIELRAIAMTFFSDINN